MSVSRGAVRNDGSPEAGLVQVRNGSEKKWGGWATRDRKEIMASNARLRRWTGMRDGFAGEVQRTEMRSVKVVGGCEALGQGCEWGREWTSTTAWPAVAQRRMRR